jgi:hypothetical protein
MRAWRDRARGEAINQLSSLTSDAVRVLRNAVVRGSLPAALAILKNPGRSGTQTESPHARRRPQGQKQAAARA